MLAVIGTPVVAVAFTLTLFASTIPTREQRLSSWFTDADLRAVERPGAPETDPGGLLPPGTRAIPVREVSAYVERPGRRVQFLLSDLPVADPITRNRLVLSAGRLPTRTGEVAMSETLLDQLDAVIGRRIWLTEPGVSLVVTGTVTNPMAADRLEAVASSADIPAATPRTWLVDSGSIDARLIEGHLREAAGDGTFEIYRREALLKTIPRDRRPDLTVLVAGALLVVTALVAAAAFATAARRHVGTFALLTANGAEPRELRFLLVCQAGVLGAVAALGGTLLGLVGAALLSPRLEHLANRTSVDVRLPAAALVTVATAAVIGSIAASIVPAWRAGQRDVTHSLVAPRQPQQWVSALGLGLFGAGLGWLWLGGSVTDEPNRALLGAGGLAALVGGAFMTPAVLRLSERLGRRLPVPLRIATRDAARSTSRVAPTTAAGMAAIALAIAMLTVTASRDSYQRAGYVPTLGPDQLRVESLDPLLAPSRIEAVATKVADVVPGSVATPIRVASAHPDVDRSQWVVASGAMPTATGQARQGLVALADERVLRVLGAPPATLSALRDGKVVALGAPRVADGSVQLRIPIWTHADESGASETAHADGKAGYRHERPIREADRVVSLPAVTVDAPARSAVPLYLASKEVLTSAGLSTSLESWLLRSAAPLDDRSISAARDLAGVGSGVYVTVEEPPADDSAFRRLLAALGVGFATVIAGLATALAAAENRRVMCLLDAVGISPRSRRLMVASQASSLSVVALASGVPIGLVSTVAALVAYDTYPVVLPWLEFAVVIGAGILLPTLAAVLVLEPTVRQMDGRALLADT